MCIGQGANHRLAEESLWQHCAERYRVLCPTAATVDVVERRIEHLCSSRGSPWTLVCHGLDVEVVILSRLVEVYIGLRMCTSICAISERILLHGALTSATGHHASWWWIVEKALAAMHDAMQDAVSNILYMTAFIALLLDGSDRQRHHINEYAVPLVLPMTGLGGMCEMFLGMVDVACGDAEEFTKQLESVLLTWMRDRDW